MNCNDLTPQSAPWWLPVERAFWRQVRVVFIQLYLGLPKYNMLRADI